MYNYLICNPLRRDFDSLQKNMTYLWVIHADKIPPHVGISSEARYYSLKVNGKDENVAIDQLYKVLMQKDISFVLFQLKNGIELTEISRKFKLYRSAGTKSVTCLDPINKLLICPEKVNILSDLLSFLEKQNLLGYAIVFGKKEIHGILNYTTEDIKRRLEKLENAERR